jgi:hypothetical protein
LEHAFAAEGLAPPGYEPTIAFAAEALVGGRRHALSLRCQGDDAGAPDFATAPAANRSPGADPCDSFVVEALLGPAGAGK